MKKIVIFLSLIISVSAQRLYFEEPDIIDSILVSTYDNSLNQSSPSRKYIYSKDENYYLKETYYYGETGWWEYPNKDIWYYLGDSDTSIVRKTYDSEIKTYYVSDSSVVYSTGTKIDSIVNYHDAFDVNQKKYLPGVITGKEIYVYNSDGLLEQILRYSRDRYVDSEEDAKNTVFQTKPWERHFFNYKNNLIESKSTQYLLWCNDVSAEDWVTRRKNEYVYDSMDRVIRSEESRYPGGPVNCDSVKANIVKWRIDSTIYNNDGKWEKVISKRFSADTLYETRTTTYAYLSTAYVNQVRTYDIRAREDGYNSANRNRLYANKYIGNIITSGTSWDWRDGESPKIVIAYKYFYSQDLSVSDIEAIPTEFTLHENYPNPFNPTTTLRFDLPEVSNLTLTIYNMLGQRVRTFNMQSTPAGYHSVKWNATNDYGDPVGAGVYLYQLQTKDFVKTRKMVLLK